MPLLNKTRHKKYVKKHLSNNQLIKKAMRWDLNYTS